nr:EAL domain-containing protein [Zobellella endophytica]
MDYLKIDRSFVGRIGVDALSSHLVDNVIDLATRLELQMVAEGVETRPRWITWRHGGCTTCRAISSAAPCPWRYFPAPCRPAMPASIPQCGRWWCLRTRGRAGTLPLN